MVPTGQVFAQCIIRIGVGIRIEVAGEGVAAVAGILRLQDGDGRREENGQEKGKW